MSRRKSNQLLTRNGKSHPNPTAAYEMVTKELADEWLETYNTNNRKIRDSLATKYTRDRVNGKQIVGWHAIAFDWDGIVMNGQHTLTAISESGLSELHLIVRGLDPRARLIGDTDAPRRAADIIRLSGHKDVSFTEVAIVRSLMNGLVRRATMMEIVEAYELHRDAAKAAFNMFPQTKKRHITIAYVMAPLARAWYTEDHLRLEKFADVLYRGLATRKGDLSAIALREYLLGLGGIGGDQMQREIYNMTETALRAFLDRRNMEKLVATKEELFPLPEVK